MHISNSKYQITKIFLVLFLFTSGIFSQINDSWIGIWKGELVILNEAGTDKMSSIHMELHITKTDSANIYNWRIVYKDSTKDDRKYLLRTIDKKNGKYVVDEKDGILLEANLFENTLVSRFEVENSLLDISYKLDADKIVFEVISSLVKPTSSTLSQLEQVQVNSYTVTSIQRAYLFRSP